MASAWNHYCFGHLFNSEQEERYSFLLRTWVCSSSFDVVLYSAEWIRWCCISDEGKHKTWFHKLRWQNICYYNKIQKLWTYSSADWIKDWWVVTYMFLWTNNYIVFGQRTYSCFFNVPCFINSIVYPKYNPQFLEFLWQRTSTRKRLLNLFVVAIQMFVFFFTLLSN